MFCSGSRFENVRAGPASYVVFGARKLTSKRSRSGNAVRSEPWFEVEVLSAMWLAAVATAVAVVVAMAVP